MDKLNDTFINYLQLEQPGIWESLLRAADIGLVHIDKENDAVTATNRLLLTYPDLHEVLNLITESWYQQKAADISDELIRELSS